MGKGFGRVGDIEEVFGEGQELPQRLHSLPLPGRGDERVDSDDCEIGRKRSKQAAGKELPSIRALAAALNVSVITIKRAYLDLENEGVIVTRHGKGSFVADVNGLAGELQEEKIDEHLAAAAGIARQLGLTEDELAARLRRALRNVDKK